MVRLTARALAATLAAALAAGCTGEMSTEYAPPERPSAPQRPGDEPEQPADPSDPGDPGDPADPADPMDPVDPSDPADPSDPTEPDPDPSDPLAGLPAFEPAPPALQRLPRAHYQNALRDLLGVEPPADLEADTPLHGYATVGGAELTVSPRAAEQYEAAAQHVVDAVFADPGRREGLVGCDPADDACVRAFVAAFGRRAWRRPLAADEVELFTTLAFDIGARLNDRWQGLAFAVSGLLQSPDFLFRVERGEAHPDRPGERRYTDHEMASRLSFLLWATTPDDALLDAADAGRLTDDAGLAAEVERMLDDPRSREGVGAFFAEYLGLDALDHLDKDPAAFPLMSATLGAAMRAEIDAMVERLALADADFRGLLTTRTTTVGGELAALYGLPAVEGPTVIERPSDSPRAGLFGTAGFLAMTAHRTVSSPTHRGKYIQNKVMCFDIPPPPPGVATSLDEVGGEQGPMTTRQKLAQHRADPTCAACHRHMDPIGLGLENFDAIGAWRTTENGLPIDASSEIDGTPFEGAAALGDALAARPEFAECVARQMFRHGTGHLESRAEEIAVRRLGIAFAERGHRVRALLTAMVMSDAFRLAGPPNDMVADGMADGMGDGMGGAE